MMKRLALLTALIGLMFLASACRPGEAPPSRDKLSPEAARGASVYKSRCLRCHKVDGAGGRRGPDLSHIGSKRDAAWLTRFLTRPQAVDPGNKMPTVFMSPDELRAVVNYLRTLN